jgi:cytochrome o ubiquinol oxidase subunit IV
MNTLRNYYLGFSLSLALTLLAATVATGALPLSRTAIVASVVVFALLQFAAQLYFFLHIGREERPYKNTAALLFTIVVIGIVVGGTLWIMTHLTHAMPTRFEGGVVSPQTQRD